MIKLFSTLLIVPALALAGGPKGKPEAPEPADAAKLEAFKGKLKGRIVWSTSRDNPNHDLYIMNADGSDPKALTKGPKTDWYPRWSPDGKQIIFTRSKRDWENEMEANSPGRWDTWLISADGTGEKMIIANSSWATWRPGGKEIVFARGKNVFTANLDGSGEKMIVDGEKELGGGDAQNPNMSDDGKYIGITLRGKKRETGILNTASRSWFTSGGGCQINFYPGTNKVFRVNQTGKGGTQFFNFDLSTDGTHGEISGNTINGKNIQLMDLPGKLSHEYFPKTDLSGKWLVWCATQKGHDHDMADYEVHIWKIGDKLENAIRLTNHSGNDRWPDLFLDK